MSDSIKSKIKLVVTLVIIVLFLWFLVISPMITFRSNEKKLENAARRYFELNSNELPTGERVKTLELMTLYNKAFLEDDFKVPYTNKVCSLTDSWVKVKREGGEYKYYVYLECGVLNSTIDHKGPEIKLVGDSEITVSKDDKYKEPGVRSVVDNSDGKLNVKDVVIKGKVDTSKVGTYEVNYTAFDSLRNKTTITRKVNVVQTLESTVKKDTNKVKYYRGENPNNYVYFSNMLFRIIGLNGDNVKIVADKDIANVNYDGIDEWFKYYEDHLTSKAKKLIVESKYCNMTVTDTTLDTTECNSYGEKKKFGLLSIDEINRVGDADQNYLMHGTITWTGNAKDNKNTYANREYFFGTDVKYMSFENKHNYGVRPVVTIKGNVLIKSGNGSEKSPYVLEDYIKSKKNVNVNTRYSGEYITYGGILWRIVDINKDGTTKIISEQSLYKDNQLITVFHDVDTEKNVTYNPKQKGNAGYYINNRSSEFIDTSYFVNRNIKVPIYKGEPNYGKEVDTKTYKVKVGSPNMYEMFSATTDSASISSYWVINSSNDGKENPGVSEIGVVMDGDASTFYKYGIRPVANLSSKCIINSGTGTKSDPYVITK